MGIPLRQILELHRDDILLAASEHRAHDVRIFGSVARGDTSSGSDIDLIVEFEPGASLLRDHAGLVVALEDLLGVPVDIVNARTLRSEIRDEVLAEAVPL